jgi:hypothetical protein
MSKSREEGSVRPDRDFEDFVFTLEKWKIVQNQQ